VRRSHVSPRNTLNTLKGGRRVAVRLRARDLNHGGTGYVEYAHATPGTVPGRVVRSAIVVLSVIWGMLILLILAKPTGTKVTEYHLVYSYMYLGSGLISLAILVRPALLLVRSSRRVGRGRIWLGQFAVAVIAYGITWYFFLGDAPFFWIGYLR